MHTHTHTQRQYVCQLGWMCNLTHAHIHRFPFSAHTHGIYRERLATERYGMQKYTKINSIIHCGSYLVIQSKVTCMHAHTYT